MLFRSIDAGQKRVAVSGEGHQFRAQGRGDSAAVAVGRHWATDSKRGGGTASDVVEQIDASGGDVERRSGGHCRVGRVQHDLSRNHAAPG